MGGPDPYPSPTLIHCRGTRQGGGGAGKNANLLKMGNKHTNVSKRMSPQKPAPFGEMVPRRKGVPGGKIVDGEILWKNFYIFFETDFLFA